MSSASTVGTWLKESLEVLKPWVGDREPCIGLILGSGLGAFAETALTDAKSFPYEDIPHFPVSKVPGHAGKLWLGCVGERWVLVMQGRGHPYEGWGMQTAVHPVRTMVHLGAQVVLATNAAGSVNLNYEPGSLVLMRSFINHLYTNPLYGENPVYASGAPLGPRFPDAGQICTPALRAHAQACACTLGQQLPLGVYAAMPGPCYESIAEVEMLRRSGADVVGMSTVHELMAAHHMGAQTIGISCVSNWASGLSAVPLDHKHVAEVAGAASSRFVPLVERIIATMPMPA